jgi:hypothetical protein
VKFKVSRTSDFWGDKPPTSNAIQEEQIKNGRKKKIWMIDIENLNDLLSFAKEHGSIVFSNDDGDLPEVEIYDDYRE